jgi:hypothetical protein
MIRKAIGATFILLLMTQVISAQQDSGSAPLRPGLHFKDDKPSRTKGQNEYDKDIDRDHQSKLKEIPDTGETDPWGISVPLHQRRPKTNNNDAARHFPPPLAEQAASGVPSINPGASAPLSLPKMHWRNAGAITSYYWLMTSNKIPKHAEANDEPE